MLQPEALQRLDAAERAKARVIVQSAPRRAGRPPRRTLRLVAVGHLRAEKDPLTLLAAARMLPAESPIRIVHIGDALDASLGDAARQTQRDCDRYRWLGGLPHAQARRWIADAHALVHASTIEGGANVVIEALRSGVAVLASRIDGNTGLLGADYDGCFAPGDAAALAALMQRYATDGGFAARLAAQCAARAPLFDPALERGRVRELCADLIGARPR